MCVPCQGGATAATIAATAAGAAPQQGSEREGAYTGAGPNAGKGPHGSSPFSVHPSSHAGRGVSFV